MLGIWLRNILPDRIENLDDEGLYSGFGIESGVW